MSEQPPQQAAEPERSAVDPARGGGRHELPPDEPAPEIGELHAGAVKGVARRGRSQLVFGALAVVLCVLLGVAIVTQARQTESGDSLETARPADLLVLLDSLQQREAALNTEVADLQRNLAQLQASGSNDQAAIENAQARLAALSILIGTVAATGPGVTLTIEDTAPGGETAGRDAGRIDLLHARSIETPWKRFNSPTRGRPRTWPLRRSRKGASSAAMGTPRASSAEIGRAHV